MRALFIKKILRNYLNVIFLFKNQLFAHILFLFLNLEKINSLDSRFWCILNLLFLFNSFYSDFFSYMCIYSFIFFLRLKPDFTKYIRTANKFKLRIAVFFKHIYLNLYKSLLSFYQKKKITIIFLYVVFHFFI